MTAGLPDGTKRITYDIVVLPAVPVSIEAVIPTAEALPVAEQYVLSERKALAVTTTQSSYTITTTEPQVAQLIAIGDAIHADTQAISNNSPRIPINSSVTWTLGGQTTTIYAKAASASGTLYIVVFKKVG